MARPFASRADRRRGSRRSGRGAHRANVERSVVIGPTPRRDVGHRADPPEREDRESGRDSAESAGTRRRPWAWLAAGTVLGLVIGLVVAAVVGSGSDGVRLGPAGVSVGVPPPAPGPAAAGSRGTWGERVTTDDGLAIEVNTPSPFNPSPQAAGHDRDRAVVVTTTIVNGTGDVVELNTFAVGPTATHRGRPAARIFDVAGSLVPAVPVTAVAPGETFSYRTAFSLDGATGELVLQYASGAVFTGDV